MRTPTMREDEGDDDDDLDTLIIEPHKGVRVFSELLKTGWRPSMETDLCGNR